MKLGFAITAGLGIALGMAASVNAADLRGLGTTWPNAADVSRSVQFHAYRWDANGMKYVQINNASGNPVMALAVAGRQVLILPIGNPDVVQVLASKPASSGGQVIYDDGQLSVVGDPTAGMQVVNSVDEECRDPVECGKVTTVRTMVAPPPAAMAADETCTDPVSCGK